MAVQTGHNVAVAFALTIAAGFATVLGGMVVFNKRLMHLANPESLAIALSVSAGVMLFISFVEIFGESVHLFEQGILNDDMSEKTANGHAWLCATICFIGGIALIYVVDAIVHKMSPEQHATEVDNLEQILTPRRGSNGSSDKGSEAKLKSDVVPDETDGGKFQRALSADEVEMKVKIDEQNKQALQRMGVLSALAIGIHNLPEGIATYVGSVHDPSVGFSLAIGIGLHNIPEGIAVAAPIYFATGSRWRGIMWCAISAVAEPVGGIIAWLAIGDGMDPVSEGILFGIVCGIMVCICMKELLPTAFSFSHGKIHLVTLGSFAGMLIMVTSLIMFAYAGV